MCFTAFVFQAYYIICRFFRNDIIVGVEVKFENIPFPSVTVCNNNPYKNSLARQLAPIQETVHLKSFFFYKNYIQKKNDFFFSYKHMIMQLKKFQQKFNHRLNQSEKSVNLFKTILLIKKLNVNFMKKLIMNLKVY